MSKVEAGSFSARGAGAGHLTDLRLDAAARVPADDPHGHPIQAGVQRGDTPPVGREAGRTTGERPRPTPAEEARVKALEREVSRVQRLRFPFTFGSGRGRHGKLPSTTVPGLWPEFRP